jgi:hypothetical protein
VLVAVCALTEAGTQSDFESRKSDSYRLFEAREKCTIPCGGVGLLPRERVPENEIVSACDKCTTCNPLSFGGYDSTQMITSTEMCESHGCCKWEAGKIYGGYCKAAKLGVCSRTVGPEPDTTRLSVASGINCKDLPSMGVSPWKANAADAGFELRDCDNPTDVCGSYCVAIQEVRGVSPRSDERVLELGGSV